MFPVPLAARPIDVLLFVQLKIVPGIDPVKATGAVLEPLHNTWLATGFTIGVGSTVTDAVMLGPVQVTPALV
jgi:hypothetical protein